MTNQEKNSDKKYTQRASHNTEPSGQARYDSSASKYTQRASHNAEPFGQARYDSSASKYNIKDSDISNACSTTDCTGLMPRPPLNEAEYDSYEDIYHFKPPLADKNDSIS